MVFMQTQSVAVLPVRIGHPVSHLGLLRLADDTDQTDCPTARRFRRCVQSQFKDLSRHIDERRRELVWRS